MPLLKNKGILIAITALLAATILFYFFAPDTAARYLWNRAGAGQIAVVFAKEDAGLLANLGNYYFNGGAYNLHFAKIAYKKALAADPKRQFAHYQLARIYFVEGNHNAALSEINRELELYPENLRSLYIRGLIHGYRGDLRAARNDFIHFVAWAPTEWAGYNDLAWVLSKEKLFDPARNVIRNAMAVVPEAGLNPWLWNSLGVIELNLNNRVAAREALLKADRLAAGMSDEEWARAYPGNNPAALGGGLQAFRQAIRENLETAETVDKN